MIIITSIEYEDKVVVVLGVTSSPYFENNALIKLTAKALSPP